MSRNALTVQNIQRRIDAIVEDAPKRFRRLNIVMTSDAIWKLITQEYPNLGRPRLLILEDTSQITPPVVGDIVPDAIVQIKQTLLEELKEEVITFFKRLQTMLTWNVIFKLCSGGGRIITLQPGEQESINIIAIFESYIEKQYEEMLIEQRRQARDSSSSSEDSCNIGASYY